MLGYFLFLSICIYGHDHSHNCQYIFLNFKPNTQRKASKYLSALLFFTFFFIEISIRFLLLDITMDTTDNDQEKDVKVYEQKHRSLQKFVPMLKNCIDKFKSQQPMPPDKLSYLSKIEKVHEILTDPSKK